MSGENSEGVPLRSRVAASLSIAFAMALLFCVVEPLRVGIANWDELSIGLSELVGSLLRLFALCSLSLAAAATTFAFVLRRRGLALECALLLGLFVQSQFFLWEVGVFDGSAVDWSRHAGKGWLELGFWLLLLGTAWFRPEALGRRYFRLGQVALPRHEYIMRSHLKGPTSALRQAQVRRGLWP